MDDMLYHFIDMIQSQLPRANAALIGYLGMVIW